MMAVRSKVYLYINHKEIDCQKPMKNQDAR